MEVRVTPEHRELLFSLGELPFSEISKMFEDRDTKFKAIQSSLSEEPDKEWVNDLLVEIRKMRV
jgi:hypothetical protein